MVKITILLFVTLLLSCSTTENVRQTQESIQLESVEIDKNGSYSGYISSNETTESCKTFVLRKNEIIDFFRTSRIATSREYSHDLTASNCYASGSFVMLTGAKGTWKIDQARRGIIDFNNSSNAKYYYCSECKSVLFYESCDIKCIHAQ